MPALAQFTRGQRVTSFCQYDCKGTIGITEYVVSTCGKKRAHLLKADGSNAEWRVHMDVGDQYPYHTIIPALPEAERDAYALKMAADFLVQKREHYARCLAGGHGAGYDKAIEKDREALHEPRFIVR